MNSSKITSVTFQNERETDEKLIVRSTNWGEPYEEGVSFDLTTGYESVCVSLTKHETRKLYELLGNLLKNMR